jgi:hypothetical protein
MLQIDIVVELILYVCLFAGWMRKSPLSLQGSCKLLTKEYCRLRAAAIRPIATLHGSRRGLRRGTVARCHFVTRGR